MKLRNAYILCATYLDVIQDVRINIMGKNKVCYTAEKFEITEILKQLSQVPYLKNTVMELQKINENIYSQFIDANETQKAFDRLKIILCEKMSNIIELCDSFGLYDNSTLGLDIKLPSTNNFTDFKENIENLEFILTKCPFFQIEGEEIHFRGVDVGSQWLSFIIVGTFALTGTSMILNNIAAFIDECAIVESHKLENEKKKIEINNLQMESEAKNKIINALDMLYESEVKNAINKLENITDCKITDGEDRGKAEQSLKKMNNLIGKGLQIYSSIDSPEETQRLFDPLEMKYLSVTDEIKALEEKED